MHWNRRNLASMSCEDMAEILIDEFTQQDWPIYSVSIFEDNENGAEVIND